MTEINENEYITEQDLIKNEKVVVKCSNGIKTGPDTPSEMKLKYGVSYTNKSIKILKQHPLSKRKSAPSANHLTNVSAKVVLFEQNVEIKDLESKVKYLQNKIKDLENENRTLQAVQSRQERELKKFKEGVADIPSLLKAHKEEIKAYESTILGIRKELRDYQKELKFRNEAGLKKDSQIDKLNFVVKQNKKIVQEHLHEIKELKIAKKNLEEENRLLVGSNQNLKCEKDNLCKKIKDLCNQLENLEETLNIERNLNEQLKIDLDNLQQKNEIKKLKVFDHKCNSDEESSNFNSGKEDSFLILSEVSFENNCKTFGNSFTNESVLKVLADKQSGEKAKNALIHTLKCYQEFTDKNLTELGSIVSCGIKGSNLKLPPLKQPCRKYTQDADSFISCASNKDFSPPADINLKVESEHLHYDKLSKDFQHKLQIDDFEVRKHVKKPFSFKG